MAGRVVACSSSSHPGPLWSYTQQHPPQRPSAAVLQSISTHAPLTSIAVVPPAPAPPSQRQQQPAPLERPFRPCDGAAGTDRQQQQLLGLQQQQQQFLEQLEGLVGGVAGDGDDEQPPLSKRQQRLQQTRQKKQDGAAALEQLLAAAKWRLQLDTPQLQLMLHQILPSTLKPGQLAHAAHAVSVLPHGPAAVAGVPGWQRELLAAAGQLFAAGRMDEWASSVLLQALVRLGARPEPAWLHAACAGMQVAGWQSGRSLATVAACLPQLGHVPSSSWADAFFAATADQLRDLPAVGLARMLHGVVAWRHLQLLRQQQDGTQQEEQQQELVLPEQWLVAVLQQLHACSSVLKPCEVAMLLQSLARLQAPGCLGQHAAGTSSGSTQQQLLGSVGADQPPDSLLQLCSQQLLHALLPAVLRLQQEFSSQDFAVALHSLALLQEQEGQAGDAVVGPVQQLCSWEWLQQVLPAVQGRLVKGSARTQVTTLWAAAVLLQPHLQLQAQQQRQWEQQQQQRQQQQQQQQQSLIDAERSAPQQPEQQPSRDHPSLQRPVWQGSRQGAAEQQQQQQQQLLPQAAAAVAAAQAAADVLHSPPAASPAGSSQQQGVPSSSLQSALQALTALPTSAAAAAAAPDAASAEAGAAPPAAPDAARQWLGWLDCFYAASLPRLSTFSGEDLVVGACTLATQQQVPPVAWYEQLLAAVHQQLPGMTTGQVAGVAWALGRMALLPCRHNPGASLVPLQPWLHALYARAGLGEPAAAEAVTPAATGPLEPHQQQQQQQVVVGAVGQRVGGSGQVVRAGEVVRLMWAAAACDYDAGDTWWAAAEQRLLAPMPVSSSHSSTTQPTTPPAHQAAQPQPVVSLLPTRLLGGLLQAYAAAGRQLPSELTHALLTTAVSQRLCAEPLVNTLRLLRGLARTRSSSSSSRVPRQWLLGLASGLQGRLALLSLRELSQLLECLAEAGLQGQDLVSSSSQDTETPPSGIGSSSSSSDGGGAGSWAGVLWQAVRGKVATAPASDVCQLLWGAAKLQLQLPADLVQPLLQAMRAGFLTAPPASLALGIHAVTRLGVVPSRDWLGGFLMATHRSFTAAAAGSNSSGSSGGSSVGASIAGRQVLAAAILQTLQGLSRLQAAAAAPLPAKWLKQQLLLLHGQLPLLRPRHVASLLLLLARLKCRPSPAYLHSMLGQLGDCGSCSALDLVHIAYGIASLSWRPNRQWVRLFLAASADRMPQMSNQGLALLHWALGVMRVVPPKRVWTGVAVEVVAARLGQLDALQLSMIVWAWGRMQVHLIPLFRPEHVLGLQQRLGLQRSQQRLGLAALARQQLAAQGATGTSKDDSGSSNSSSAGSGRDAEVAPPPPPRLSKHWQARRQVAQQLLAAALQLRGEFSAPQLTHLLFGLAKLQVQPTQAWLHAMVTRGSRQPLSVLDGLQLQRLLWALARMRYRAPAGWVEDAALLAETRGQQHASLHHSAGWAVRQLRMLAAAGPPDARADTTL